VRYTREFVERARETARRDQETLDDYVLELRESYGLSWSQLAAALGTSAPGAAKRHAAALTRRDQQEHNR
jgi:predicted ArsR family transcriptional regulator